MSKKRYNQYSEEFKLSVVRDYYSSGMSKYACQKKYKLSSSRLLRNWLSKYEYSSESLPLSSKQGEEDMANRSQDSYKEENAQLKSAFVNWKKHWSSPNWRPRFVTC